MKKWGSICNELKYGDEEICDWSCMNSKIQSTHFWIIKCEFHSFIGEIEGIGLERITHCRFWLTSCEGKESYGHIAWSSKTSFSQFLVYNWTKKELWKPLEWTLPFECRRCLFVSEVVFQKLLGWHMFLQSVSGSWFQLDSSDSLHLVYFSLNHCLR